MTNFNSFQLPPFVLQALTDRKILTPTPVQAAAIPPALAGEDILASAQTGSGKTIAYAIPLIMQLLAKPISHAMVLTPTRELATQVQDTLHDLLGKTSGIRTALLIGGESMGKQFSALRARPRIIVGTPGRIQDHLTRKTLMLHHTQFLVVDEADRMLDMGFSMQLEKILQHLPATRQTLMFSATLPPSIVRLSERYLRTPTRVTIDASTSEAPKIQQSIVHTSTASKFPLLLKELETRTGSVIIFVKTKRNADILADKLLDQNESAAAIHGDLSQRQRDRVIQGFRDNRNRIMVATDIAARGLDIPHIEHVINYDVPQCPEDYIHRIGRTGRAGREGQALCFVSPEDNAKWKAIDRLINPGAPSDGPSRRSGAGNPRAGKPGGGNNKRRFSSWRGTDKPRTHTAAGPRHDGQHQDDRGNRAVSAPNSNTNSRPQGAQRSERPNQTAGRPPFGAPKRRPARTRGAAAPV